MPEKKLADRIRDAIRLRGYSYRTEKAYVHWYERYVRFHGRRVIFHGLQQRAGIRGAEQALAVFGKSEKAQDHFAAKVLPHTHADREASPKGKAVRLGWC